MRYLKLKDKKRRIKFEGAELEILRLKILARNMNLPIVIRYFYQIKLFNFSKDFSKVRIRNRCVITGRGQSVSRLFHLNRSTLKQYINSNLIFGVRRSSW